MPFILTAVCSINWNDNGDKSEAVSSSSSSSESSQDEDKSITKTESSRNDDVNVNVNIHNDNNIQVPSSADSTIIVDDRSIVNTGKKVYGKDKWYSEFESLKREEKSEKAIDGYGHTQRNIQGKYTKAWDDDLNAIWAELKSGLDSDVFKALTKDELNWISYKENTVKKKIDEQWPDKNTRNAWTAFWENLYIEEITIERCYYLVDNYMF